jgi:hypothetical protein
VTEIEIPLQGGRTTAGVVRVGDTVRRPVGANSAFVHRLLRHLEAQGFSAAPRFLGIDAIGREILSFLPGEVPDELADFSLAQIANAALLRRSFHDATAGSGLTEGHEVVCHGDFSPCNCVFDYGIPSAMIDFDASRPGRRLDDLGYAAWLWLRLGDADLAADFQALRIAAFFRTYGTLDLDNALPAILDAQTEIAQRRGTPPEVVLWAERSREWVTSNLEKMSSTLKRAI